MKLPELLAPAGSLEKLITAVTYGADAVYLGGKRFSLRAKAGNFSMEDMGKGVKFAHDHGVKVYVTANIFAHNRDFTGLEDYLKDVEAAGVDGLIVADPGILRVCRKIVPHLAIHLSTQTNVTNGESAAFWEEQGVSRMNLARELSLKELSAIRQQTKAEIEVFVHGALCISYSGRCMLSNYMTNRDANLGQCSHPCRFSYHLTEEKRPGQYFPVEEDERGTYIFNSKDLCLLKVLPELIAGGVDSIKIEGRMKSIFYVGGVVRIYRAALDYLAALEEKAWLTPEKIRLPPSLFAEIEKTGTRGVTENFFRDKPDYKQMLYTASRAEQCIEPVAVMREKGRTPLVEVRNTLFTGEKIEFMEQGDNSQKMQLVSMHLEDGTKIEKAHPGNRVFIETDTAVEKPFIHGIFRREKVQ